MEDNILIIQEARALIVKAQQHLNAVKPFGPFPMVPTKLRTTDHYLYSALVNLNFLMKKAEEAMKRDLDMLEGKEQR